MVDEWLGLPAKDERQKEVQTTNASSKVAPYEGACSTDGPEYVYTAGIALTQVLLWHRALLHFQPSTGALPILPPARATSASPAWHAQLAQEEAAGLASILWHIGCGLFFVWSGWKAAHAFAALAPTSMRLDARNRKERSLVHMLWKLVFQPLRNRVTLFLPVYMLTVSLVHFVFSLFSSHDEAAPTDMGDHFNYFHINIGSHLLLFFPYALTMWVVHCPLFYSIAQAKGHVTFSWRLVLLGALTPAILFALALSLPLGSASWHLGKGVLLIYGPPLACMGLRPALLRSQQPTLLALVALLIYGGRLVAESTDSDIIKVEHYSLAAFLCSLLAKRYSSFVSFSALYVLGFLWVHCTGQGSDVPTVGRPPSPPKTSSKCLWTYALFCSLSFIAAASVLASSFDDDYQSLSRLCHDYFVLILAVLIKYWGNQPFEGISERLLRDSSFLVFLLYPVCASMMAIVLTLTSLPFEMTLVLMGGGTLLLCYGLVCSVLLFAPPTVCASLVRFNSRCLCRIS